MILDLKWSPTSHFLRLLFVSGRHDLPFDAQNISFDLFSIAVLFIAAK